MRQQGASFFGVRLTALCAIFALSAVAPGLWTARYFPAKSVKRTARQPVVARKLADELPAWRGPFGCDPSELPRLSFLATTKIDWSRLPFDRAALRLQWDSPRPPVGTPYRPAPDWSWYGRPSASTLNPTPDGASETPAAQPIENSAELPISAAVKSADPTGAWRLPESLIEQLQSLSTSAAYGSWAMRAAELVRQLSAAGVDDQESRYETLSLLVHADLELKRMLSEAPGGEVREARRVSHGLSRRLQAWRVALALDEGQSLSGMLATTVDEPHGPDWRDSLLLDALEASSRDAESPSSASRLLDEVERYELSRLPSDGKRVALNLQRLKSVGSVEAQPLVADMERHYRNCNLRIAVTAEMLNRWAKPSEPVSSPVRDTILGVPVRGSSVATGQTRFRLTPDDSRLRMTLEVAGDVRAETTSRKGSVSLYSDSSSRYTAVKRLELDMKGIRWTPVEVEAQTQASLRGMTTDYDGVPLVGSLVRGFAQRRYVENRQAARMEAQRKLEARLRARIDKQTDEQLTSLDRRFSEQILVPLERLALDPALVYLQTDAKRMTLRARLAQGDQLAAHTPRPMAPSDSVASLQIHESAVNNAFERLELSGRSFTVEELKSWVAFKVNRGPEPVAGDADPQDETLVRVTFAKQDAVRVRCHDGRLELSFALESLQRGERRWEGLELDVAYRPQPSGLGVELVRDGILSLAGTSLNIQSQFILRTTFNRLFSEKARWGVLVDATASDPHFTGLAVTQCVIEDGWIGLAVGPARHDLARETSGRRF